VWQKLYEELEGQGLEIITVAMDTRPEAARRHIEKARSSYVSLIDRNHLVADLYNMTNVPQAVWIDEEGRLVRGTEVSGFSISTKFRAVRKVYMDALRDWAEQGAASEFVLSPQAVREQMPAFTDEIALSHAYFHLGQSLWNKGQNEEAFQVIEKAVDLNPDSWNFYRQMKNLDRPWKASGPAYFGRAIAKAIRGKTYYPLPDMPGIAEAASGRSGGRSQKK
jgi:tetratricopeptide (TPR) repeat protein